VSGPTGAPVGVTPQPAAGRPVTRVAVLSTIATLVGGMSISVQTAVNGHVSVLTGSPVLATAINHGSGLVVGLLVALAIGAFPRAWRSLRDRRAEIRWWWFLGGLMGFAAVLTIVLATPEVGVVTIAVAITLGQLAGSVIADSGGLGPGGRRGLNALRLLGIGVAILAVLIGGLGHFESGNLLLVPLVVLAGLLIALQQAANGWILVVTGGEWAVMTVINFVVSGAAVAVALGIQVAIAPPDFSAVPWWAPAGGLVGAIVGVVIAFTVRTIGVLSSMLCVAAGQSISSILADALVPINGIGVTVGAVVGAILAVLAVALAGLGATRRPRAAAAEAAEQVS